MLHGRSAPASACVGLARDARPPACSGRAGPGVAVATHGAALPTAGEAGHLPVHERRPVAPRHLRPQAGPGEVRGPAADGGSSTRRPRAASCRRRSASRKHGQSGIDVSELLPHLARVIDDCCVIRSMHTDMPNHEPALLHDAHRQPPADPAVARLVAALRPGHGEREPAGVRRAPPQPRSSSGPQLWSNSFLPGEYQGTA